MRVIELEPKTHTISKGSMRFVVRSHQALAPAQAQEACKQWLASLPPGQTPRGRTVHLLVLLEED